jgi:hypothetical protein
LPAIGCTSPTIPTVDSMTESILHDGIDALLELRTRQMVVDLLHLGLLFLLEQPHVGHRDERLPQRYGDGKGAERGYESVMSFTFDCRNTIEIAHQCCWRASWDKDGHRNCWEISVVL